MNITSCLLHVSVKRVIPPGSLFAGGHKETADSWQAKVGRIDSFQGFNGVKPICMFTN